MKMNEAYFQGAREQLAQAVKAGDTRKVNKIMDEAEAVVDDLYGRMPADPPYRDYGAPPKL